MTDSKQTSDEMNNVRSPWTHGNEFRAVELHDNENRHIATLHCNAGDPDSEGLCRGLSHNSVLRNARMMTAAPEMLDALEQMAGIVQERYDAGDISGIGVRGFLEIAQRTIAKAKGIEI